MGRKPIQPVCDRDCFHCPYPDCIVDEMSAQERRDSSNRERSIVPKPPGKRSGTYMGKEYYRAYYHANQEKCRAYARAYYERHRDEITARVRARYREQQDLKRRLAQGRPEEAAETDSASS